jgi:asparagine synthase (glutamine-hydrolysing)
MSAVSAAVTPGAPSARALTQAMLDAMLPDGAHRSSAAAEGERAGVSLGAGADAWERALRAGAGDVATRDDRIVAADATLYHRDDLRRTLRHRADGASSDASLILAVFDAWGIEGISRLEGDFAFVLWDGPSDRLIAARSFAGHRTLFHAVVDDGLRIATRVGGLLRDAAIPRTLDLAAITTVAAGLWAHARTTAYSAIDELAPGHVLTWDRASGVRVAPFWLPPHEILHARAPLDAAAEELRALLVSAVRERLAPDGTTALSLSGGWDSSSVGAAATVALGRETADRLRPVSISYPAGDPGREDELILDTVAHWGTATRWVPVDGIALLPDPPRDAAARDLPFAHAFEHWNRALSRHARLDGARVLLDGVGGDQLFQVSDILLSDLFARGQWVELARQWRARGGSGLANAWRWAVRPALPPAIPRLIARLRGMPAPPPHLHRHPSWWVNESHLEAGGVLAREMAALPALPTHSRVLAETHAYLRFPFFGRILGVLRGFARDEGVELRSPLLDDRVVRFAVRRPWSERSDGRETKILLRRAMRGLVPDSVLAPRAHRTGVTSAYFLRQLRGPARAHIEDVLRDPLLARLGVIDADRLRSAWAHVLQHDDDDLGGRLFFTVQAEWWARAHGAEAMR